MATKARLRDLGRTISDDFAFLRDNYRTPRNPIVLCHGLLGFDELRVAGRYLPAILYWRGISEVLKANGIEVITTSVPASASIEERATALLQDIERDASRREVNLIGHSMGGIDARYMISRLKPSKFKVLSLTTIVSPHQGSAFADYCFERIGQQRLPRIYKALNSIGMDTGAFSQLTMAYMKNNFNPTVPDDPSVRYFSYGAMTEPSLWSPFRLPHRVINEAEGPNDGLVSVASAHYGTYKGTLVGPNHLDIINWTNRLKWAFYGALGSKNKFNALALYCDIADMLAEEGL